MTTLYQRIRRRREDLDMSQAELAEALGYGDRSTIAKIESGKNDLTQSKIVSFAEALHTTPAYLMGWTDDYYDYDLDEDCRASEIPIAIHKHLMKQYDDDFEQVWRAWVRMEDEAYQEACRSSINPCFRNTAPVPENCNIIKIAGRDGSYRERHLTDEQLAAFNAMLDALPNASDDI